jgi:Pseudouridine synthase
MTHIIRLKSGGFTLSNAVTFEEIEEDAYATLLPVESYTDTLTRFDLAPKYVKLARSGVPLKLSGVPQGDLAVYAEGTLLGVGREENGILFILVRLD